MEYQGQIIDTHMHIWNPQNGHDWLAKLQNGILNYSFFYEDYLQMAKKQRISQTVYVECGGFPQDPSLETAWIQKQADLYGGPQGIVAYAPLDLPDVEELLKKHKAYPNLRGIRMPLNSIAGCFGTERSDYMKDPQWRKGYALLSKYDLSFDMQIYDIQIPDAVEIVKTYDDISLVLEHMGWPLRGTLEYLPEWKERLSLLAQYPQVFLKLSCLGWIFQGKNDDAIIPFIQAAIETFGPERCMVGSNCPPDLIYTSFDAIFQHIRAAVAPYSQEDQQKIFYGNAKRVYKLS